MFSTTLLLAASMVVGQADEQGDVKQAIVKIEEDWTKELAARNVSWFDELLVDDWQMIMPGGQIWDKKRFIGMLKSDSPGVTSWKILELQVRVYGRTAVALARGRVTTKADGKVSSHEECWTDVYVRAKGQWRCVSAQSAIAKAKREEPKGS